VVGFSDYYSPSAIKIYKIIQYLCIKHSISVSEDVIFSQEQKNTYDL